MSKTTPEPSNVTENFRPALQFTANKSLARDENKILSKRGWSNFIFKKNSNKKILLPGYLNS